MASRFWVGGSGNLDGSDTTHISASSGGAGGASYPTSADNLTFDSLSNATSYTVTVTASMQCADLTFGAPLSGNLTLANTSSFGWGVYGSFSAYVGLLQTQNTAFTFLATSTGKTITCNGFVFANSTAFQGVGGGWTLQDAFTVSGGFTLAFQVGSVDTNGKTVTTGGSISFTGTNTRSVTFGASVINCAGINATTTTNLTFSAGTSSIVMSGNGASFVGGGLAYYDVSLTNTGTTLPTWTPGAGATFHNLTLANTTAATKVTCATDFTCSGTFTVSGLNAGSGRLQVISSTFGTPITITAAIVSLTNVDFRDITGAGAATWSGTIVGNAQGNSGITFTTPTTLYKIGAGSTNWFTTASWSLSSGGASGGRIPLPQDSVIFDTNSFSANNLTCTINYSNSNMGVFLCGDFDISAATNRTGCVISGSTVAGVVFHGNVALASSITIGSSFVEFDFGGRGSQTITSNGATISTSPSIITTGTYSLVDALIGTSTFNLYGGTFTTNNFAVTVPRFSTTTFTFTRAFNMGSSIVTLTAVNGAAWDCGTSSTGLTVNAGTSTIVIPNTTAQDVTFKGGTSQTYYNVTFSSSSATAAILTDATTAVTFNGTVTCSMSNAGSLFKFGFGNSGQQPTVNIANLVFTGFAGTWASPAGATPLATNITTSLVLGASMLITNTAAVTFNGTSATTITSNGKTLSMAIIFNGVGGTFNLSDAFTTSSTITLTQGTLALGALTAQCTTFSTSNSNTRAITGTGIIALTSTGTIWTAATSSGLSVGSGVIIKSTDSSNTASTFAGGGATYGTLYWNRGASTASNTISGSNTFANFKDDGTIAHSILFTTGTTQTIALWNVTGSGAGNEISINSTTTGTHALVKTGAVVSTDYLNIQHSVATPGSTWYAGAHSINNQATATAGSGWIFSVPPNRGGGTGSGLNDLSNLSLLRLVAIRKG